MAEDLYDLELTNLYNWPIGIVDRVFANGPGDWDSIPDWVIPKTKKWYLMPPCLILSIRRYKSTVSGAILG